MSSNLAIALRDTTYTQVEATVTARAGDRFVARTATRDHEARRALSCLVEPAVGDTVLLAVAPSTCFVLAVLTRAEGAPAELRLTGDLTLRLARGRFTVVADEGVELATGARIQMLAGELGVQAGAGEVFIDRLALVGSRVTAEVERVKTVAATLDQTLDRWSQRVKRVFRRVEEIEQVRAEQIDYAAETTLRAHGRNTVVTAEQLVKMDGEQIHLG